MIVDITAVSRDLAVRSIAQLEGELFGRGAWNANMVREELDAPARTYLLDVLGRRNRRLSAATPASGMTARTPSS